MNPQRVELLLRNPKGEIESKKMFAPAARLPDLAGKRIALITNTENRRQNFPGCGGGIAEIEVSYRQFFKTI